jgi:signal transduction histidine kinase
MYPHPFGGAFMFYEDVTDRLALERSYNTLLAVRQETLEHLQEAVAVIGADGRLKLSNPRFHEMWGIPTGVAEHEPHIRDLLTYLRPLAGVNDDRRWNELSERIVASATEPMMRSGRKEFADGRIVDWAQVPLPDAASLFTYLDVTDTIKVERALRERNEALETADRLKSEFIANVSYELRTPLNAINGFAEMLDGEYFGKLNPRQHEHAQGIVRSAEQLSNLINDILDLASIEAGYMELEPSEVAVADLVEGMNKLAGERRLRQALFNLLSNAVNFTPEGGDVTLRVDGDAREVRFTVTDTGPGIPLEAQKRLFQPFEHGGIGPRRPGAGAGLGLALVKRVVELHGGAVELESKPGAGTSVTCHVPRAPVCSAAAPQPDLRREPASGR